MSRSFYGRWSDVPHIKTKKGRCSFCRQPNRKVALMQTQPVQFCGACMLLIMSIVYQELQDKIDHDRGIHRAFKMRYLATPYCAKSWDRWVKNSVN